MRPIMSRYGMTEAGILLLRTQSTLRIIASLKQSRQEQLKPVSEQLPLITRILTILLAEEY